MKSRRLIILGFFSLGTLMGFPAKAGVAGWIGLSETQLIYEQTSTRSLNQWVHTLRGGMDYHGLDGRWSLGLGGSATLGNSFGSGASSLQIFSFNTRVHRKVYEDYRFRIFFGLGFYYTTTAWSNYGGGYQDILGPELYPSAWYSFPSGHDLGAFVKYSPMSSGFSLLPIDGSHEFALGLVLLLPSGSLGMNEGRVGVNIDYSELGYFEVEFMRARQLSFGASFHF